MAVGDVFLVRLHFNVGGNTASVGLHFRQFSASTGDDPTGALATTFGPALAELRQALAKDCQIAAVEARSARGGRHMPSLSLPVPTFGTLGDQSLPLVKSAVVKLGQTDNPGRRNGRCFIPGIAESSTTGNLISEPLVGVHLKAFFDLIRLLTAQFEDNLYEYLHVIRTGEGAPVEDPRVFSTVLVPIIYSQRRRRTERRGVVAEAP